MRSAGLGSEPRARPTRAATEAFLARFVDGLGVQRAAPASAVRAVVAALESGGAGDPPPACVVTAGQRRLRLDRPAGFTGECTASLVLEDGAEWGLRARAASHAAPPTWTTPRPIPIGVHRLWMAHGRRRATRLVLARPPAHLSRDRRLAVFLPLHAVRPGGPFGVATYAALYAMSEWATRTAGALLGTLPLFPAFLGRPFDPSPYAPVTRLMWNELYVDPRPAPEWRHASVRRLVTSSRFQARSAHVRAGRLVDYSGSWSLAREVLRTMAQAARAQPRRWNEVAARAGVLAESYARFRAAVDATGRAWNDWPAAWRAGRFEEARADPADVDLYVYAQALAAAQIASLTSVQRGASPLYLDLPVGVHAYGFDTFTRPDLFLHGMSAGAPPDALNAAGQVWGFPPLHPTAGRADGYAHLRAVLRRLLSVAGVLRIDHVMGLYRMYCVPAGHDGTQGVYLRYPEQELAAIVMIEAHRAGAAVVGEDLGTVPPQVRTLLRESGMLGMHVQQFALHPSGEARCIAPAGPDTLASLNTHDTPTFAGFWHADDVALRRRLGHLDARGARRELAQRRAVRHAVAQALHSRRGLRARDVALALMRLQARGEAAITLVNLEDLWGERSPQNVPGTTSRYPNWRRRAARSLPTILRSTAIAAALKQLARDRRRGGRRRGR